VRRPRLSLFGESFATRGRQGTFSTEAAGHFGPMEETPRIRDGIEALPAVHEGRQVLVLHDRAGISSDLVVDRAAAPLLALMDGRNDLRDMQVALMRMGGLGLIELEEIKGFLRVLDENFLLDNARYHRRVAEVAAQYRRERVRRAAHAGRSYPSDPDELRSQIEGYFAAPEGPSASRLAGTSGPPCGLVLPHIDFHRGGTCYAWGYAALQGVSHTDLFVILGTSHLPMELPFAMTTKDFETPLGSARCASELVEAVCRTSGLDLLRDELAHRSEHTIEFQVLFLQHLLGGGEGPRILPVLCSGFHKMMERRTLPSADPEYCAALEALEEVLKGSGLTTCLIASADLAHLGPQFGDPRPVDPSDLARIRREDEAMLQPVLDGNADGFFRFVMAEGDRRRICGLPPIYAWLRLLPPREISLLRYDQAFHPQATVTFATLGAWAREARADTAASPPP